MKAGSVGEFFEKGSGPRIFPLKNGPRIFPMSFCSRGASPVAISMAVAQCAHICAASIFPHWRVARASSFPIRSRMFLRSAGSKRVLMPLA